MTPFRRPANIQEEQYNRCHQQARHRVERCIGVLKSRFRCLSRQRILMYTPAKAGAIINGCVVLHNIMVEQHYEENADENVSSEEDDEDEQELLRNGATAIRVRGEATRQHLVRNFF